MSAKTKKLTATELSAFCSQVALILKAGISVQEGIAIMEEDNANSGGTGILSAVREKLEVGTSFYDALSDAGVFPKYMLDMVQIGEQSGRLDEVMDSLSAYYERSEAVSQSLRSAIVYPTLMIVMMLIVIGILIVKVLPIFGQVFSQLGRQLSPLSQSILHFGLLLNRYAVFILAAIAIIAVVLFLLKRSQKGSAAFSKLFHGFIGTRRLAEKISAGRFASAMALMLSSGLDVDQSLQMSYQLVDDRAVREKIKDCQKKIDGGTPFADAIAQAKIFSNVYARMITVGFKTGSVDAVMQKIADRYENEVDEQINHVISLLEPSLVAVLSLIVGMILLSVMLPLMGIMTSIG